MSILPSKLIPLVVNDATVDTYWPDEPGDPFANQPYRWALTCSVSQQDHGSHLTPTFQAYNGLDITVGMWVADINSGNSLKIISITNQTTDSLECIAEDVDRFNTFHHSDSGTLGFSGLSTAEQAYAFELGEDGMPILGRIRTTNSVLNYNPAFIDDLNARFVYRNSIQNRFTITQASHGFTVGDIIRPSLTSPGTFEKAIADSNANMVVGIVMDIGIPTANDFTFKPLGRVMRNVSPALVGNLGDLFYLDPTTPGALTKTRPNRNVMPIYMRLNNETTGLLLYSGVEGNGSETKVHVVETVTNNQTEFVLPSDAASVLEMEINGIETTNYTFDAGTHTVTFDPITEGFSIETTDTIKFLYRT